MIRLLIVGDVRLYREGLAQVLQGDGRTAVVGTAARVDELLENGRDLDPQVVLLDMTSSGSLNAVRAITAAMPEVKVVALGVPEVEGDIIAYAEAGVAGYVPREASVDELVSTVTGVARGELPCSPRIAGALLRRVAALAAANGTEPQLRHLTTRELEIAQLIEAGLSNKEIAGRLCIEVATVKNHVHSILKKLQVRRRGEAAALVRGASRGPTPPALATPRRFPATPSAAPGGPPLPSHPAPAVGQS